MPVSSEELAKTVAQAPMASFYRQEGTTGKSIAKVLTKALKYLENRKLTVHAIKIQLDAAKEIAKQLDMYPAEKIDIEAPGIEAVLLAIKEKRGKK